jgi:hypothetical protein
MTADPQPDPDRPTVAPFVAALVVIVLVVIVIALLNVFDNDDLTDEQLVARAAVGQNDALQRSNFSDYRVYTCAAQQGDEAKFIAVQRESANQHGARFVDGVSGVTVDGNRATATVTYHFDKAPDDKTSVPTTFAREGGAWKVCSPAAR